ncbi:MAG: hypothetical protein LC808_07305, partial [Actinobacteria bacterium]|nr:hypothetical protein [Actinomycetota bacterium]
ETIFERQEFVLHGRSGADRHDVDALRGIFLFVERGAFQFARLPASQLVQAGALAGPAWRGCGTDRWRFAVACCAASESPEPNGSRVLRRKRAPTRPLA